MAVDNQHSESEYGCDVIQYDSKRRTDSIDSYDSGWRDVRSSEFYNVWIAGSTLITATTSNYTSTNSTLLLVTKAATSLGLSSSPNIGLANGSSTKT